MSGQRRHSDRRLPENYGEKRNNFMLNHSLPADFDFKFASFDAKARATQTHNASAKERETKNKQQIAGIMCNRRKITTWQRSMRENENEQCRQ